jgi:hypothetical protein
MAPVDLPGPGAWRAAGSAGISGRRPAEASGMRLTGSCHCGNIGFVLEWAGDPGAIPARACACSFCVKHGGVWTSDPRSSLAVAVRDASLVSNYAFGTRTATFHVCARCGAVPLVTSDIAGHAYAVVNVNALDNVDRSSLRHAAADFEGEEVASRLARRSCNWIADVRFTAGGVAGGAARSATPDGGSTAPAASDAECSADGRRPSGPSPS